MSRCYVVVEGPSDRAMLSVLLGTVVECADLEVIDAGGRSSAVSLARTLLATRPGEVALLVDADATHPDQVSEVQLELEGSLGAVSARERFGVFLAVPSLEACLFRDEEGLRREFGNAVSAALMEQSRHDPKSAVEQLLRSRNRPYNAATQQDLLTRLQLDKLRDDPVISNLKEFILDAASADVEPRRTAAVASAKRKSRKKEATARPSRGESQPRKVSVTLGPEQRLRILELGVAQGRYVVLLEIAQDIFLHLKVWVEEAGIGPHSMATPTNAARTFTDRLALVHRRIKWATNAEWLANADQYREFEVLLQALEVLGRTVGEQLASLAAKQPDQAFAMLFRKELLRSSATLADAAAEFWTAVNECRTEFAKWTRGLRERLAVDPSSVLGHPPKSLERS